MKSTTYSMFDRPKRHIYLTLILLFKNYPPVWSLGGCLGDTTTITTLPIPPAFPDFLQSFETTIGNMAALFGEGENDLTNCSCAREIKWGNFNLNRCSETQTLSITETCFPKTTHFTTLPDSTSLTKPVTAITTTELVTFDQKNSFSPQETSAIFTSTQANVSMIKPSGSQTTVSVSGGWYTLTSSSGGTPDSLPSTKSGSTSVSTVIAAVVGSVGGSILVALLIIVAACSRRRKEAGGERRKVLERFPYLNDLVRQTSDMSPIVVSSQTSTLSSPDTPSQNISHLHWSPSLDDPQFSSLLRENSSTSTVMTDLVSMTPTPTLAHPFPNKSTHHPLRIDLDTIGESSTDTVPRRNSRKIKDIETAETLFSGMDDETCNSEKNINKSFVAEMENDTNDNIKNQATGNINTPINESSTFVNMDNTETATVRPTDDTLKRNLNKFLASNEKFAPSKSNGIVQENGMHKPHRQNSKHLRGDNALSEESSKSSTEVPLTQRNIVWDEWVNKAFDGIIDENIA